VLQKGIKLATAGYGESENVSRRKVHPGTFSSGYTDCISHYEQMDLTPNRLCPQEYHLFTTDPFF
jgi:hypothetical protein